MPDRNRDPRRPKDATTRADSEARPEGGFWSAPPPRSREPRIRTDSRAADYGDYESDEIRPFGVSREHPARAGDPARPAAPPSLMPHDSPDRGRYYGVGPKGYRRSDERIREDVSDRLMMHPDVDASDIEVHVANGIITLTGTVADRHQKRIADFIAEDVVGVDDVHNQLKVRHGFWSSHAARHTDQPSSPESEPATGEASAIGGRADAARAAARRDESAR